MILYLVVPKGVSEKLPLGVFRTREAAEAAAELVWPRTDGYHDLDVHEYETGVIYDSFSRGESYSFSPVPPDGPRRSDFHAESTLKRLDGV